jgi:hypothetical protein
MVHMWLATIWRNLGSMIYVKGARMLMKKVSAVFLKYIKHERISGI